MYSIGVIKTLILIGILSKKQYSENGTIKKKVVSCSCSPQGLVKPKEKFVTFKQELFVNLCLTLYFYVVTNLYTECFTFLCFIQ